MADAYFFKGTACLSANGFDTFTTCFYPGKSLSNSITACKVVFARRNGTATGVFATWPQTEHVSTKARTNTDRFATRQSLQVYNSLCQVFVKAVATNVVLLITFN